MLKAAQVLNESQGHGVRGKYEEEALSSRELSGCQHLAFTHLTSPGDLKCVVGYAGTGKSYLLGACLAAWESQGYAVVGATLSGIAAENLTRIFGHGFTTRRGGHGFGLHSGALAARELGGSLSAHSEGPGKGATFKLRLPLKIPPP